MWLKILQCDPEAAKIISQYGAEIHQRNSISVLVELLCTLDSRLFSAGASRILVHALHATRLDRTNFPTRWTFFRDCVTFVNFARLIGLKTLCPSVVSMKTSAARRPEAFLTNCHTCSTLPLNFSHSALAQFSLRLLARLFTNLMVHQRTLFSEFTGRWSCAITIQASTAVEIVFKWTAGSVLPLEPFLQSFPFSVSLKPETS